MQKFKITYEIGDFDAPDVICTRLIEAGDADLAVTQIRNECNPWDGGPLKELIMFRIKRVERT